MLVFKYNELKFHPSLKLMSFYLFPLVMPVSVIFNAINLNFYFKRIEKNKKFLKNAINTDSIVYKHYSIKRL